MKSLLILALLFLSSCSGYRFKKQSNPFENFGVKTVAIPLFLNQSSLPNTAPLFTSEIITLLSQFPDLKIVSDIHRADAVLVGIINSQDKYSETFKTTGHKITNSVAPKSLAGRSDFFVPFASEIKLEVRYILIKDPLDKELKLLQSELAEQVRGNPKIIFNERLDVVGNFNREIYDLEGGQVNFTQNKGALERTMKTMAQTSANNFKEMILYAF